MFPKRHCQKYFTTWKIPRALLSSANDLAMLHIDFELLCLKKMPYLTALSACTFCFSSENPSFISWIGIEISPQVHSSSETTDQTWEKFMRIWVSVNIGFSDTIATDQGTQFHSQRWRKILVMAKIKRDLQMFNITMPLALVNDTTRF